MSITSAIKRGASAVQSAYTQQKWAAEERAKRRMASARTKLEKERAKLALEREKVALQQELADAKQALARERRDLAEARASARGPSRMSGVSKGLSGGWKALEKWYDRGSAPPKKRKTVTKRKITTAKRK